MLEKVRKFFLEVKIELGKVSWSTRKELFAATLVVIMITTILAVYIGVVDYALSHALRTLIK